MTQSDLIQEIEEEVQRKRMAALWGRYAPYVIGGALLIVISTAAYVGYTNHRTRVETEATAGLVTIMSDKEADAGKKVLLLQDYLKKTTNESHQMLAQLQSAALALKAGDKVKALELYDALAANSKADAVFRDLAVFLSVQTQMDDADPKILLDKLKNLQRSDCAWRFSAKEYAGHLLMKSGDKAAALKMFMDLANDQSTPEAILGRASAMVRYLGVEQK